VRHEWSRGMPSQMPHIHELI